MPKSSLPFQPIPQKLYARKDLFRGFKSNEPASWGKTVDFAIYRHFVMTGGGVPTDPYVNMMQALHDNAITQSTADCIARRKVAAIMGDHMLARNSPSYEDMALLSRRLTRSGILVCTGGGPGAMEASHLGALLAAEPESELDRALAKLKTRPNVPDLTKIVNPDGVVDETLVAEAHAWFKPAHEIAAWIRSPSESLAVPTWQYGHEPTTPFATSVAKYFQNSIREDGLLALAKQGIVYSEGKAGTIQEIFQDSTQNFYNMHGYFSPMVLFGVKYWTEKCPVVGVLERLFDMFHRDDFAQCVLVTDKIDAAAKFIETFTAPAR